MRGLLRLKRVWAVLLLPLSLLLVSLAGAFPAVTERVYSTGIYPLLAGSFGRFFSLFPFSLTEWLALLLVPLLLAVLLRQVVLLVRRPQERPARLQKLVANLLCIAGVGYFCFLLFCGFNYHRESFAQLSGLEVRPSSAEELSALCGELAASADSLRATVAQDPDGVMQSSFANYKEPTAIGRAAYATLGEQYPVLNGYTVRPKPVVLSRGMSWMEITGIYMPFTFEANVNVDISDYWVPSTMLHELAHSKGFMREDEANFISYLACTASDHPDFTYSGVMLALTHSTNALYAADRDAYWAVVDALSDPVKRDFAANRAYWKEFEGPIAEVSSAVNDVYLRSNRQAGGVKSYGRMVDLLLAEYRQRHGLP